MGKPCVRKPNSILLLSMCTKNNMCIANTMFQVADQYKTTVMHTRSKYGHLTDYYMPARRPPGVRITHTLHSMECWTDHRLVTGVNPHIAPLQCDILKAIRTSFNTTKLKHYMPPKVPGNNG